MKNLSISKKLIIGFGTILVMILIIIGMAIYSINGINDQINSYAKYTLPNSTSVWMIRRDTVSIQRNILRGLMETREDHIAQWFDLAQQDATSLLNEFDIYAANQRDTGRDAQIAELRELFNQAGSARREIAEIMKTPQTPIFSGQRNYLTMTMCPPWIGPQKF